MQDGHLQVFALQRWVDTHGLDFGHVLVAHPLGDCLDDVLVNADVREIRELGDQPLGFCGIGLRLDGGSRARVGSLYDLAADGRGQDSRPVRRGWPWGGT